MYRQLDYQDRVLSTLDAYLDLLKEKKVRADKVAAYLALGLSLTKAAARLEVSKATLSRFIKRRKIKPAKHVEVKGNG